MASSFTIHGDKESGKYSVFKNGEIEPIFEITGMHTGGLKSTRQWIGEYLKREGQSLNSVFEHQCMKPNRKYNPKHKWTVERYLIGVPEKK